ncbi:MAG: penicillin-binding transpeptidase domain-containing protein, partial [Bacteroidota bacterium]
MSVQRKDKVFSIQAFMIIAGCLLLFKAAHLQLFDSNIKRKARATTMDKKTLYPSRGLIYDRNDKLLVYNNPIYDLMAIYNKVDQDMDVDEFCDLLEISKTDFDKFLNKDWGDIKYSKSSPFIFMNKIPASIYTKFQEHLHEFPGFYPVIRNVRGYPHESAAQALGYISEVNQKQIENSDKVYQTGDYIGTTGLEKMYEATLRGKKGISYMLKDNLGREVAAYNDGNLESFSAESGGDLIATIDLDLQKYGESLMANKIGGLVAIEPSTGEILSLISMPDYDPNDLVVGRKRGEAFNSIQKDTLNPFFNRSLQAQYPPGSIFKPILSLIGLQEGVIVPYQSYTCKGAYYYNGFSYGCHAGPMTVNLKSAIKHSCNSYYFQTFRDVVEKFGFNNPKEGLDLLDGYLYDFGLGKSFDTDMANAKGNVPTPADYDKMYSNRWRSTYIMSMGIGQGELLLTTLQMANLAAILGNRGYFYNPHLVREVRSGNEIISNPKKIKNIVPIEKQHFELVIDGMRLAVTEGTAKTANVPGVEVCGKTGTSQNPHGEDHSVFYAFAPKDNPKIAIAVYIENAGWGG